MVTSVTAVDWAYENAVYAGVGTSIVAGAVPEPSSLSLLALGATGLAIQRRRVKT